MKIKVTATVIDDPNGRMVRVASGHSTTGEIIGLEALAEFVALVSQDFGKSGSTTAVLGALAEALDRANEDLNRKES